MTHEPWPQLRYDDWKDTLATLHLWTQVVGKVRLAHEPRLNHWWQVALYVTPRGLTTSAMPYGRSRTFVIDFDFIEHALSVNDCDGNASQFALEPMPVADFYDRLMATLSRLDLRTPIRSAPARAKYRTRFHSNRTACTHRTTKRLWSAFTAC